MGRIVATIDIENVTESGKTMKLDALVDTDASYITLPHAWKERFGKFSSEETIELQTDNGEYEPLLGYIALEQCGAAVDMIGHRLLPVKYMDVK